jgi:hypothetical protein
VSVYLFPPDVAGILVLSQADESGVPQVIVAGPSQDSNWPTSTGLGHWHSAIFAFVKPLAPSAALAFR